MLFNQEIITRIRHNFVIKAKENCQIFHPLDVERVQMQDWAIERFVLTTKSEDAALKALVKAMQWRKAYGVNDLTDDYFPEEIYKIGLYSVFSKDKEGRPVLWFENKRYHKSTELGELIWQFTVYQFEKLDRQTTHGGWNFGTDFTGAGLSNVEIEFTSFLAEILQSYYPLGLKYMLVIEMPWILTATSKLILGFMNQQLKSSVKFVNRDELTKYIERHYIPIHLNGTYQLNPTAIPSCVKPLQELCHTLFTRDQIENVYSIFKSELKE